MADGDRDLCQMAGLENNDRDRVPPVAKVKSYHASLYSEERPPQFNGANRSCDALADEVQMAEQNLHDMERAVETCQTPIEQDRGEIRDIEKGGSPSTIPIVLQTEPVAASPRWNRPRLMFNGCTVVLVDGHEFHHVELDLSVSDVLELLKLVKGQAQIDRQRPAANGSRSSLCKSVPAGHVDDGSYPDHDMYCLQGLTADMQPPFSTLLLHDQIDFSHSEHNAAVILSTRNDLFPSYPSFLADEDCREMSVEEYYGD